MSVYVSEEDIKKTRELRKRGFTTCEEVSLRLGISRRQAAEALFICKKRKYKDKKGRTYLNPSNDENVTFNLK